MQHSQYSSMEPILVRILNDADSLWYDDKGELRQHCLSSRIKHYLMRCSDQFDTNEKRHKESVRIMGLLQKFIMDRMLEKRSLKWNEDDIDYSDGRVYVNRFIRRNNMMAAFKCNEKCRCPPTLKQFALTKLQKTPLLILKKMSKTVTFKLIQPIFIECCFRQRMEFIEYNERLREEAFSFWYSTAKNLATKHGPRGKEIKSLHKKRKMRKRVKLASSSTESDSDSASKQVHDPEATVNVPKRKKIDLMKRDARRKIATISSKSDSDSDHDSSSKQNNNPSQRQNPVKTNLKNKKADNFKVTKKNRKMRQSHHFSETTSKIRRISKDAETDADEDEGFKTPGRDGTCAKCNSFNHKDDFDSMEEEDEQAKADQPIAATTKNSKKKSHKHEEQGFQWIRCNHCSSWFHFLCSGLEQYEYYLYEKFFCEKCVSVAGPSIELEKVASHRYNWYSRDEVNKKTEVGSEVWIQNFAKMEHQLPGPNGNEVCIVENGHEFHQKIEEIGGFGSWKKVYLIKHSEGLNMRMPDKNKFDIESIMEILGEQYEVDTIDVYNQNTYSMKLNTFVKKFRDPNSRVRLYNFLSLEFSDNEKMCEIVSPPQFVENISMVDRLWPDESSEEYAAFFESGDILNKEYRPQLERFCLAGMANSYTDFHIDFGGSSVYYHIFKGKKVFYIAEPTKRNLNAFEKHETTKQTHQWFGDKIRGAIKRVVIEEGQTLLIPSGWIHAVWTPVDSLVFGGNFLHLGNAEMQMRIYQLETAVRRVNETNEKFYFPNFEYVHWMFLKNVILNKLIEINDDRSDIRRMDRVTWKAALCFSKEMGDWCKRDEENDPMKDVKYELKILHELQNEIKKQKKIQKDDRTNVYWRQYH